MIKNKIQALFDPNRYHGWAKEKSYFEGWYYKLLSKDEQYAYAIIPGIAMDEQGKKQAFIQILDGKQHKAEYIKFKFEDFISAEDKFQVSIRNNHFNATSISLDLPQIQGKLQFKNQHPWPSSWYSPGIMGPFSFVPFMQCYHGILSMDHTIEGLLNLERKKMDFTGGKGYMEKDWGRSFPEAYFWLQSNHFKEDRVSLKCSVAKIPWMGTSFVGFIAGFLKGDELIQFTTYNFSRLKHSYADQHKVELLIESPHYRLEIFAERQKATALASPIMGFMDGRIEESMTSILNVKVINKKDKSIFYEGKGRNAGLEVAGDFPQIMTTA